MKHKNTGSVSHKNTGYNNHTNTYGNHTNVYNQLSYEQYLNHKENYGNYNDYNDYVDYGDSYGEYGNFREMIDEIVLEELVVNKNSTRYGNYSQNSHSQSTYNQSGSFHTNTGYNNHSNTGYTNHININENVEPTVIGPIKDWTSAYYKDTIKIYWEKATDNNKCISVISSGYGDNNASQVGIYENNVRKITFVRGITISYWDNLGVYKGYSSKDTYTDINYFNQLKDYYNNIPNNSIVAIGMFDAIAKDQDVNTIKNWLTSIGINSANVLEGNRSAFAYILKKGGSILSQQSHRYGANPTNTGTCSAKYTIPNVNSSQTITYTLQYAFKAITSESFGAWTDITKTETNTVDYSLENHTNGFIKFRIIASDGVENSSQWKESKEVRVLKYNKPNLNIDEIIKAKDINSVDLELEKLNTAIGLQSNPLNATTEKYATKNDITLLRNKINSINRSLALGELTDSNLDIIYRADIENIKKNIEKI